jgi:hypothetical protein
MDKLNQTSKKVLSREQREVRDWFGVQGGWEMKDFCLLFDTTIEKLESKSRLRELVTARSFIYAYYYSLGNTQEQIGQAFGGRDHATVLHSIKTLKGFVEMKDPETMHTLNQIRMKSPHNYEIQEEDWAELEHAL